MRNRKRNATGLFVTSLILFAIQAGIWARATRHAHSETDKQNIEIRHQPNEMAGIAGMFLLLAAGVIASIPTRTIENKRGS